MSVRGRHTFICRGVIGPPVLDIETGFEGGHGSHWDAVVEEPSMLSGLIGAAYREGSTDAAPGGASAVRVRTLPLGDKGFEMRILEIPGPAGGKAAIATAYPHLAAGGKPLVATPTRIIEWGNHGLEAEVGVELEAGRGTVTFFATDYFARSRDYRAGGPLPVRLSAVAYTLGVISPERRVEKVEGRDVDVSRAAIVAPLKDSERAPYYDDDFFLQGPAVKVEPFAYPPWDEGVVVRVEVPGLGAVPVFGRKKAFPHGWPRLGEFVAAYVWMQGRLA
ncbi:MAG TPA: hypothetical protein VGB42_12770 [Candidatus Thermoplasmatota archaeon]